jgi:hypothetical protein
MTARKELENYVLNYLILDSWGVSMHLAIRSWKNAHWILSKPLYYSFINGIELWRAIQWPFEFVYHSVIQKTLKYIKWKYLLINVSYTLHSFLHSHIWKIVIAWKHFLNVHNWPCTRATYIVPYLWRFFFAAYHPDWLWGPPNLPLNA